MPHSHSSGQVQLPFGEALGAFDGVTAFSNLDDSFFSGEKHFVFGVYTGYKYQCVEFARRYLLLTRGCIFGQCFRAAEIFRMTSVTHVETGAVYQLTPHANGESTVKPKPGDILVYPHDEKLMPVGHVAIVATVTDDSVGIAEQNQESYSWRGKPCGRTAALRRTESGQWCIEESDPELLQPSGWLSCDEAPHRSDVHAALHPIAEFVSAEEDFGFMRRRIQKLAEAEATDRLQSGWLLPHIPQGETDAERQLLEFYQRTSPSALESWRSVVYPNERSGVGCIGTFNATFRAVAHGLKLIFGDRILPESTTKDGASFEGWASSRYGMPSELVALVEDDLSAQALHNCLASCCTLSFTSSGIVATDFNFDSLTNLFDAAVLQGRVCTENGHAVGWCPSIHSDVKRFVENVISKGTSPTLYFLDVGVADTLPKGTFIEGSNSHVEHDLYRLNGKVLMDFINRSKEGAAVLVTPSELGLTEGGDIVVTATGAVVTKLHKLCTWATAFHLSEHDAHLKQLFVLSQVRGKAQFYPPLFAHIVGQQSFAEDLKRAFALQDESKLNEGQLELKDYLPNVSLTDDDLRVFTSDTVTHPFQIKVRAVSVGGYWSTGLYLVRRPNHDAPSHWSRAGYRFLLEQRTFDHEEEDDEK